MEQRNTILNTIGKDKMEFDNPILLGALKGMLSDMKQTQIEEMVKAGASYSATHLKTSLGVKELSDDVRMELITQLVVGTLAMGLTDAIEEVMESIEEIIDFNKGEEPVNGEEDEESEEDAVEITEEDIADLIGAIFGAISGKGEGEA